MKTLKQVERPEEKHLKILKDVCKAPNDVIKFGDTIRLNVALAAMQVLQDEIDQLQPVTEMEKAIRELVQTIHDSGLDHKFVGTMLGMFTAMAVIKGVIESKNQ